MCEHARHRGTWQRLEHLRALRTRAVRRLVAADREASLELKGRSNL